MVDTVPISHIEDAAKLEAEGKITLFEIWLRSGARLYLKPNNTVTWQGNTYEGIGIALTGVGKYADDTQSRPSLSVVNPKGIFGPIVRDGDLNRAQVHRIRVLKQHLDADMAIFHRESWIIGRVTSLIRDQGITFELRAQIDGNNFVTPARIYAPPEFPTVVLQ